MLWFYNPTTGKNFRCMDWELELKIKEVPHDYIRGRGTFSNKVLSSYDVGGVKKDANADSFKGFSL